MPGLQSTLNKEHHFGAPPETIKRAKQLRKKMTPAERKLWKHLRNRKLLNLKFRRQHPIRYYIADFYCHEVRLVIELDGGIHSRQEIKERDENRQAEIERFDLYVLRFKNEQVMEDVGGVLAEVREFLEGLGRE
ncbi:MAG: endonuclease domain-containing protein [Bacteroidales bacterium]|nr:endonuclease domain-containing protein [Bacteroidales bacterium]MCF8333622.1 endonuclease domain-containing protein [Bacteroidales bacterium]